MHVKSLQSCPTLCDSMDSSPPGSSVQRILQAKLLEWAAIYKESRKKVLMNLFGRQEQRRRPRERTRRLWGEGRGGWDELGGERLSGDV